MRIDAFPSSGGIINLTATRADLGAGLVAVKFTMPFEPIAENYFERVCKTGIEQPLTEVKGADFAVGVSGMKKADAAAYAERQIAETGWLPALLRIAPTADRATEQGDEDQLDRDDCPFDLDDQPETENERFPAPTPLRQASTKLRAASMAEKCNAQHGAVKGSGFCR